MTGVQTCALPIYRLAAKGRKLDLTALGGGARDLVVALVVGDTQFVQNRVLTAKTGKKTGRTLILAGGRS